MIKILSFVVAAVFYSVSPGVWAGEQADQIKTKTDKKFSMRPDKMMLILAAPSVYDTYYKSHFKNIVAFQINYAKRVLSNGLDDIRILADKDTVKYYRAELPNHVPIEVSMYDIWMRDFTTVNPAEPVQFVYTAASMTEPESKAVQKKFTDFADQIEINRVKTRLKIDGGNIVDNYSGKLVTTSRFSEDNNLSANEAKQVLKKLLNAQQIAIIPPDDAVLAHADGMVAWLDDDVLAVNDYSKTDPEFHETVINVLRQAFPGTKLVTVPVMFDEKKGVDKTKGIESACGVNLNLVSTYNALYVPVFGNDVENEVLKIIRQNTSKKVIEIKATDICLFGGSVRCTTWQIAMPQAERITAIQHSRDE